MESTITGKRLVSSMDGERPAEADEFKGAEAPKSPDGRSPTTIGRYLLDQALPEKYRDPNRILDSKTAANLFANLAQECPDQYGDIISKLNEIAKDAQGARGGVSPSIRHVREAEAWKKRRDQVQREVKEIYSDPDLSAKEKQDRLVRRMSELSPVLTQEVFDEASAVDNPFSWIVRSGMKGKPANINNLIGTPLLFADAKNRPIPIPILRGYGRGLSPSEYWAASYGTRKGLVDGKMAVADSGYLSKQLVQIAHRGVVTDDDDPDNPDDESRGLPVDVDDDDNIGALLARTTGPYKRNTVITAKVLRHLKRQGIERMLVRSPTVGGPQDGSVYARDIGLREQGRLPVRGENPGVVAAHALSEPLSQGTISSKHTAGVVGAHAAAAISGFQAINQFIQVPKENRNWAAHAKSDGRVQNVEPAPQGGHYVYVNNEPVYVPHGSDVTVKPGDEIEAGDILSTGLPNPALVVEHKGIGEGRRYFTQELTKMLRDSNLPVNRRNVELIARGLVNHVQLDEEMDAYVPGDKVPYNMLEKFYQPRQDARTMDAGMAVGKYLERPVLHYTIGTKIRPSVVKNLKEFGLDSQISVHDHPPPFQPQMVRGMAIAAHDPDWISSMQGSGIKSRVLTAVHRGHSSDPFGTSYVSGVVGNLDFAQPDSGGKITAPIDRLDEMREKRLEAPENPFDLDDEDDFIPSRTAPDPDILKFTGRAEPAALRKAASDPLSTQDAMPTDSREPSDASRVIAGDRLGSAVLMGGAGALGGGLFGAKTMLDKTFEDYRADRLAWSQRKQRARERGEDTKTIDRERPGWVLPYLKAAIKGGVVGGAVGGLGGGTLGAMTGPSMMRAAARSAAEKQRERMREKIEQMRTDSPAKKASSVTDSVVVDCFDYVRNQYRKNAGLGETARQAVSSVRDSLQNKDVLKKLLRATILGAGGAVAGGAAGSLLKTKGIAYDRHGRPKRKSRAGMGALLGGGAGVALGLLADPKQSFPLEQ